MRVYIKLQDERLPDEVTHHIEAARLPRIRARCSRHLSAAFEHGTAKSAKWKNYGGHIFVIQGKVGSMVNLSMLFQHLRPRVYAEFGVWLEKIEPDVAPVIRKEYFDGAHNTFTHMDVPAGVPTHTNGPEATNRTVTAVDGTNYESVRCVEDASARIDECNALLDARRGTGSTFEPNPPRRERPSGTIRSWSSSIGLLSGAARRAASTGTSPSRCRPRTRFYGTPSQWPALFNSTRATCWTKW